MEDGRLTKVLCLYSTHPVRASFPQSVPRLISVLFSGLAELNPSWDFCVVSPESGFVDGCRSRSLGRGAVLGASNRVLSHILKILRGMVVRSLASRALERRLSRLAETPEVVICLKGGDLLAARAVWPNAKRIYLPVSLPVTGSPTTLHSHLAASSLVVIANPPMYWELFRQVQHLSFPPPVVVIPAPIDIELIVTTREIAGPQERVKMGLGLDEFVIIQVGGRAAKGCRVVEFALAGLKPPNRPVRFLSIGHVQPRTHFFSNGIRVDRIASVEIQDLYRYLVVSDLGVVPSVWFDCGPIILQEMMAAGLPVLAAKVGGSEHYLAGIRGALVARPNDTDCWIESIQSLLDDDKERERLSRECQQKLVSSRCSRGQVAEKYTVAIRQLLELPE